MISLGGQSEVRLVLNDWSIRQLILVLLLLLQIRLEMVQTKQVGLYSQYKLGLNEFRRVNTWSVVT